MEYGFADRILPLKPSAIREILKFTSNPDYIPFAAGNPAAESFPVSELRELAGEIFETMPQTALQYSITEGYAPLREKIKARLFKKFGVGKEYDELITVSGGQQGIELLTKVMANEGDTIICENPSFIGALNAFRSYNVNLKGVCSDSEGMRTDILEDILKSDKRVKFIYLIPTFQNPSGLTMSKERRQEILELATRYNVLILEDNPYGELRFMGEDIPTIKSMDCEGRVVYVGSFSKILSAGMRVGFVCAHRDVISKMVVAKQTQDVHTNIFFQIICDKYMEQYDLDAHIEKIKALYRKKCLIMMDGLETHFKGYADFTRPEGGLFVWCTLKDGMDGVEFARLSLTKKVAIVPGSVFMAETDAKSSSFRLNYSTPTDSQITEGTALLGELLRNRK